ESATTPARVGAPFSAIEREGALPSLQARRHRLASVRRFFNHCPRGRFAYLRAVLRAFVTRATSTNPHQRAALDPETGKRGLDLLDEALGVAGIAGRGLERVADAA